MDKGCGGVGVTVAVGVAVRVDVGVAEAVAVGEGTAGLDRTVGEPACGVAAIVADRPTGVAG